MQKVSVSELLFEGKLDFAQLLFIDNPQYDEAKKQYNTSFDTLYETFNDEQKRLYDDFSNKAVAKQDAIIYRAFNIGIKFAMDMFDEIQKIPFDY